MEGRNHEVMKTHKTPFMTGARGVHGKPVMLQMQVGFHVSLERYLEAKVHGRAGVIRQR